MNFEDTEYLVVGAGFTGAAIAEQIASDLGRRVIVVDKKPHTGGNSHSFNESITGIECHRYGSHIFHTKCEKVWSYLARFCSFNTYQHKVLARHRGKVYQMPINLSTISHFYGMDFSPDEARVHMAAEIEKERTYEPSNFEEMAISRVGRPLYDALIRGYSLKQWGTDPVNLPAAIMARLPLKYNYDGNYFDDPWQGMPLPGYHGLFQAMLSHRNMELHLDVDYFKIKHHVPAACTVIYTGPMDRYFDYKYGHLQWRTAHFETEILPVGDFQGTSVMNYADVEVPWTRIHEYRHFHRERGYDPHRTVIMREYPGACSGEDDPLYPVNTPGDRELYGKYYEDSLREKNVFFAGRLGLYQYINMDTAVEKALELYGEIKRRCIGTR